jgi:hypothetical protein
MAYLRVQRVGRAAYYYILRSERRAGRVTSRVLEYLGRDPDPKRLKAALRYWKVGKKPGKGGSKAR